MRILRLIALIAILPLCLFFGFLFGGAALCIFVIAGFWELAHE